MWKCSGYFRNSEGYKLLETQKFKNKESVTRLLTDENAVQILKNDFTDEQDILDRYFNDVVEPEIGNLSSLTLKQLQTMRE